MLLGSVVLSLSGPAVVHHFSIPLLPLIPIQVGKGRKTCGQYCMRTGKKKKRTDACSGKNEEREDKERKEAHTEVKRVGFRRS